MDPKSGFAILNDKEKEVILSYSDVELLFVPRKNFFRSAENIFFRRHAVAIISKLARRIDTDTHIPYLAMNYFDRFLSKRSSILEDVEGYFDTIKVRLIAIACFTIAAKMRIKDFSIEQFLIAYYTIVNVRISHHMVMRTELLILRELEWELLPVTPFTFLNFYYRYFKKYGGFKRRCINEIIVQAQGEHTFVHYYPAVIAISAFLAASKIAYLELYREIVIPFTIAKVLPELLQDKVTVCVDEMVDLCNRLNIQIETPEYGIPSPSELMESQQIIYTPELGTPSTSELQESPQNIDTPELRTPSTSELQESQQNIDTPELGTPSTSELQESQQNIDTPELGTPSTSELQESQQNIDTPELGTSSTSELQESQQNIDSPELGIPSTSELKESQQNKGKAVMVVHSSNEEDDDEEDDTPLTRFLQEMGQITKTSQALKISERVDEENKKLEKGETSGGGYKPRVEDIIRQPLEKGKAVVSKKMEEYILEIAELEEIKSLMNFELKWPEIVPSIEPQSQTVNRSKSKGRILRTAKKLTRGDCKVG